MKTTQEFVKTPGNWSLHSANCMTHGKLIPELLESVSVSVSVMLQLAK